jgi:hypothetical protein
VQQPSLDGSIQCARFLVALLTLPQGLAGALLVVGEEQVWSVDSAQQLCVWSVAKKKVIRTVRCCLGRAHGDWLVY